MQAPPSPSDEAARLQSLRGYELLDTPAEKVFDELTALATRICEAPIALVTLVDENRQWFKSKIGLPGRETPREVSFCGHAILEPDLLVINDALADSRFADNPLVTSAPHIRFYAGAVLRAPGGAALGTLCVIDHVPRVLRADQEQALRLLASQVVMAIQLRHESSELARITVERERVAAQLRTSDAQFRDLIEGSAQGVVIDHCGVAVFANQSYAEIFGFDTADDILKLASLDPLYSPRSLEQIKKYRIARANGAPAPSKYDFQGVKRDGTPIWLETRVREVSWRGQSAVQSTVVDVTEYRRAQELLRLRTAAIEKATDGILIADVRVAESPRLVYASPAFLAATGYLEHEVLGLHSELLMTPATDTDTMRSFREALMETRQFRGELLIPRKGREDAWCLLRIEPIRDAYGTVTHMVCVQTDISEHKKLEQALAHSVEELDVFACSVAHDLKAPLRAMGGYSQILAEDHAESLDETAIQYLEQIESSASRLQTLIDDLLHYSRVGQGEVTFQPIDMHTLLSQIVGDLAADIKIADAVIHVHEPLPTITGHVTTIRQVFENLIANAIKFAAGDRAPIVAISSREDAAGYLLAVRDNGRGIDQAHQNGIFDMFQRLYVTEAYPGTGIGLSIVKKGVKLHNGTVWVKSEPGIGSTFYVRLPRHTSIWRGSGRGQAISQ